MTNEEKAREIFPDSPTIIPLCMGVNDKYGLTKAVLDGRKTQTRRIVPTKLLNEYGHNKFSDKSYELIRNSHFKVGEEVSIAQSYNDVYEELKRTHGSSSPVTRDFFHKYIQGGRMPVSNKMFVRADIMLHRIRITNIRVERLQDISEEDCLKEGIMRGEFLNTWDEYYFECGQNYITAKTTRDAYKKLINKVSGKGTWESNPWVFVYDFELVK